MIKVLISTSYGMSAFAPEMRKIMEKSKGIQKRTGEIVEYVETHAVDCTDIKEIHNILKSENDIARITHLNGSEGYAVKSTDRYSFTQGMICFFKIAEVDESKPWTITVYDGTEEVKYLDNRALIDEEMNYWEEK